jgi:hypothetical protein
MIQFVQHCAPIAMQQLEAGTPVPGVQIVEDHSPQNEGLEIKVDMVGLFVMPVT